MRHSKLDFGLILLLGISSSACTGGGGGGGGGSGSTVAPSTSGAAPVGSSIGGTVTPKAPPVRSAPANLATGPSLVLDTSGKGDFFDLPFPLDARRDSNGAPILDAIPNPRNMGFVKEAIKLVRTDVRGFSPTGTIYFHFDGNVNQPVDDPVASMGPSSPILLVDIDPTSPERLKRSPFHVAVTTKIDSCRPLDLVQILPVPGCGLRFKTAHAAIVLRKLGGSTGPFLGQAKGLTDLLAGRAPAGALGGDIAKSYQLLPAALADLGIHPDDVAAATVFTTCDPTSLLLKQVAHVDGLPALKPTTLTTRDVYPDFTALKGEYLPPQYQTGVPPFPLPSLGGRQVVDANGLPVQQYVSKAGFQVSVPKGKMPAGGFPLYFYVHGTGGVPNTIIDRGRILAPKTTAPLGSGPASYVSPQGWAMACQALPLSPTRIGFLSLDGYIPYNFFNPVAMRDNFFQMILELVHFRRLLLDLAIDPALCPGTDASASPDGKIHFDAGNMVVGGQSLGSYLSGMLAATLPGWKGAILTGAGGSWVEFPFGPTDPVDLSVVVSLLGLKLGEKIDLFHPLISVFDLALGPADNTHYHRYILKEIPSGRVAPNVLVIEGHGDIQVPENLQRALALAVGVELAGPEVPNVPAKEQVLPVLPIRNLRNLPYPVQGNVTTSQGPRTAVMCRYEKDGIVEGHYVVFQRDEPKRQIGAFLRDLKAGVLPTVDK